MLGVTLDDDLQDKLVNLAKSSNCSESDIANVAVRQYIEQQEQMRKQGNQETLERWEAFEQSGETVSNEAVTQWLDSWGDDDEKPCPIK